MAIIKGRYYFGVAGDMQSLPSLVREANSTADPTKYGAITRSITGSPTSVNYGHKRVWPLKWYQMNEATARKLARVEAHYRGHLARRGYLLDTRNTNYLPPDVAVCGAEDGTDSFSVSAGVLQRPSTSAFHTDLEGFVDGNLTFAGSGASNTLKCNQKLPIVAGSQYLFSGYFGGSGSMKLTYWFYDKTGTFLSTVQSGTTNALGAVTRYSYQMTSGTVPANSATFSVGVTATTSSPTINTSGWMVQYDETVVANWYPGAGSAEVVIMDYSIMYPNTKNRIVAATFGEV